MRGETEQWEGGNRKGQVQSPGAVQRCGTVEGVYDEEVKVAREAIGPASCPDGRTRSVRRLLRRTGTHHPLGIHGRANYGDEHGLVDLVESDACSIHRQLDGGSLFSRRYT
jgi:hypothetical protein